MNKVFAFKQFKVEHDLSAQKVGTDGVLLGAWTPIEVGCKNILDVGTGSGLIALMLAQKTNEDVHIDAIDIDELAYIQATKNFNNSLWKNRINTYHTSLQNFQPEKEYDLIVCNPPFFSNSLQPKNISRTQARHDDSLMLNDLIIHSKKLLNKRGMLSIIYPFEKKDVLLQNGIENDLYAEKICMVKGAENLPVKRILVLFRNSNDTATVHEELTIEVSRNNYTNAYKMLTKDFYLNF